MKIQTVSSAISILICILFYNCSKPEEFNAPVCSILCPLDNQEIFKGDTVFISVEPEDKDGQVNEVRLYIDSSIVALFFNFPYDYDWVTCCENLDIHKIKVVAMDNDSLTSEIEITVVLNDRKGSGTVTDLDGNTYKTIKIGNQQWMAENLKTSHYADGSDIVFVDTQKVCLGRDAEEKMLCSLYKKSGFVSDIYGGYYSWTAAMNAQNSSDLNPSGVQGACPAGWHIPSDSEWKQLETWLGMSQVELNETSFRGTDQGAKLKDVCSGRFGYNMGANNASGFSALPGGERDNQGFSDVGYYANFWSSTLYNGYSGIIRQLNKENNAVTRDGTSLSWGLNVRCVKD